MDQRLPIADRDFIINLHGFKAVILFPAMGTPALMKDGDRMTVVLAAEEMAFISHKNDGKGGGGAPLKSGPGTLLRLGTALKFHTQLLLTKWGVNDYCSGYIRYLNHLIARASGANTIYGGQDEAAEQFKLENFYGYYLGQLKPGEENLITLLHPEVTPFPAGPFGILHKSAVDMYIKAGYKHLFQLSFSTSGSTVPKDDLMELSFLYLEYRAYLERWTTNQFEAVIKDEQAPEPGVLKQWTEKDPIPVEWYLTNPGDELLSDVFNQNINRDQIIPKYIPRYGRRRSSRASNASSVPADGWTSISVPRRDCNAPPDAAGGDILAFEFKFFPLFNPEPTSTKIVRQSSSSENTGFSEGANTYRAEEMNKDKVMTYLKHYNGGFLCSRHPVYFAKKDYLDFGVIADTHICGRQTLFKLVAPQVIEGAEPKDSPFLGTLVREAVVPTWRLMTEVKQEIDALLWLGDLYDFVRDLNPKTIAVPSFDPVGKVFSAKTNITRTADLWKKFKFKEQKEDYNAYPHFVDAIMALSIVHNYYQHAQKPVCMVAGNHEGMNLPYGTSPRISLPGTNTLIRMNSSVASDHNLTFYEAALIFGEDFKEAYITKIDREAIDSFKKENVKWFYETITPWRDCVISHGNRQNLVMLGWGDGQDIALTTIGGGATLPRANKACTEEQVLLAQTAAMRTNATNILCSHFSYVCFEPTLPMFVETAQDISSMKPTSGGTVAAKGKAEALGPDPGEFAPGDLTKSDYGSFYGNREGIYGLFGMREGDTTNKIHITLCGHTHRCGGYFHNALTKVDAVRPVKRAPNDIYAAKTIDNSLGLDSLDLTQTRRTVSLVCGSTGLYSHQNLVRGVYAYAKDIPQDDLEPSQGMLLHFENKAQLQHVKFKRDPLGEKDIPPGEATRGAKPRLAVRLDYLWYEGNGSPFVSKGILPQTLEGAGKVVGGVVGGVVGAVTGAVAGLGLGGIFGGPAGGAGGGVVVGSGGGAAGAGYGEAVGGAQGGKVRLNHDITCDKIEFRSGNGPKSYIYFFSFKVNPQWRQFFYPGYAQPGDELPLASFTLYAVHKTGAKPTQRMKTMKVSSGPVEGNKDGIYSLDGAPSDLQAFIDNAVGRNDPDIKNWLFFFSVELQDIRSNWLAQQYDIESPWCFPVIVDTEDYQYFDRPFGDAGELPNFEELQNIEEYKR